MRLPLVINFVLTLATISVCITTNAQNSWQFKGAIDSLRHLGIDTILIYQPPYSPTTNEANDTCIIHEKGYLLWRQEGGISILKQFYCINFVTDSSYRVVYITKQKDTSAIFDYLSSAFNSIVSDKMLKSVLRTIKNGKKVIQDFNKIDVSDDAYTGISIIVGSTTYDNGYSFTTNLNDGIIYNVDGTKREVWESLNYNANKQKTIYKILTRIETLISALENLKRL